MATVRLLGRGTYGPDVQYGRGVSPLWMYFRMPPAQNSVLIYTDGTVVESVGFQNDVIQSAAVAAYIPGGVNYTTTVGSFEYDALTAAGYTWETVPERDTYTGDYTDVYP